jgi:AcrR family transcriptional regulator
MGLRERKKQQTRQLIADTAWRLFADRGFDRVTVAEVAREAEVALATVFNYFPAKEDLFFSRLEAFGQRLVAEVGSRPAGEPALAAVRRFLLASGGLVAQVEAGDAEALERLRAVNRVIAGSPALQARERQVVAHYADALAGLMAEDLGVPADDVEVRVAANAMIGVHAALLDVNRRRVLADDRPERLARDLRELGQRAFALLERGLADYAPKPEPHAKAAGGAGGQGVPSR